MCFVCGSRQWLGEVDLEVKGKDRCFKRVFGDHLKMTSVEKLLKKFNFCGKLS